MLPLFSSAINTDTFMGIVTALLAFAAFALFAAWFCLATDIPAILKKVLKDFSSKPFLVKCGIMIAVCGICLYGGSKHIARIQYDGASGHVVPKLVSEYDEEHDCTLFSMEWTSESHYGYGAVSNTITVWTRNDESENWVPVELIWSEITDSTAEFVVEGNATQWAYIWFGDNPPAVEITTSEGIEIVAFQVTPNTVQISWTAEDFLQGHTFAVQYRNSTAGQWVTEHETTNNTCLIDRFILDKYYEWRVTSTIYAEEEEEANANSAEEPQETM